MDDFFLHNCSLENRLSLYTNFTEVDCETSSFSFLIEAAEQMVQEKGPELLPVMAKH